MMEHYLQSTKIKEEDYLNIEYARRAAAHWDREQKVWHVLLEHEGRAPKNDSENDEELYPVLDD